MKIDLDIMVNSDSPLAVRFKNATEARAFYDEIKKRFPRKVRSWDRPVYYAPYENDGGVCYFPRFHQPDRTMTRGSGSTYKGMNIRVIEFSELLHAEPELVTVLSDMPVDLLFT